MTDDPWTAVDTYFEEKLLLSDPVLEEALRASRAAGLPSIQVSPSQGKLLHLLAKAQGARTILELGTLAGYSTIWLGRALPKDGRLLTLEVDPKHAEVARANVARAGLESKVEVLLGPALETLPKLLSEHRDSFDFVFLDADKPNTRAYFDWAVRLSRPGSLIVVDNVVRKGELANTASDDPNVRGMRAFLEALASDRRVSATGIQTVGTKGYDGFVLARVLDAPEE
ncbi:MAG TPA: O-methyltransferase [Thermoplasmata archaeon]|nr:O-methyltransferase [Thermoplasmata archaeon]